MAGDTVQPRYLRASGAREPGIPRFSLTIKRRKLVPDENPIMSASAPHRTADVSALDAGWWLRANCDRGSHVWR